MPSAFHTYLYHIRLKLCKLCNKRNKYYKLKKKVKPVSSSNVEILLNESIGMSSTTHPWFPTHNNKQFIYQFTFIPQVVVYIPHSTGFERLGTNDPL